MASEGVAEVTQTLEATAQGDFRDGRFRVLYHGFGSFQSTSDEILSGGFLKRRAEEAQEVETGHASHPPTGVS